MKLLHVASFFCLPFIVVSISSAQITLTSTDVQGVFAAGKSWTQYGDSLATTMNLGTPSTSTPGTWTMPTVAFTDTTTQVNMNPSATPYASSFPQATHSQRQAYSSQGVTVVEYQYNRITADSLIETGAADSSAAGVYINPKYRIDFLLPATIGQSITVPRDSQSTGPNSWQIQLRTSTMDAYGTLNIPAGSFQTLRRKEVKIQQNYAGGSLSSTDTTVEFLFLTKDNYFLTVQAKYAYQTSGTVSIKSMQYIKVNVTTNVNDGSVSSPTELQLYQNYPDPFNPSTNIRFDLKNSAHVTLKVYNLLGQEVATLLDEVRPTGNHVMPFNGSSLTSGVYFYKLVADNFVQTRRMVLLK